MNRSRRYWLALPTVIALAGTPAFAQTTIQLIAPSAPPEIRAEVVPPPPTTTVTWEAGHWSWSNDQWVWTAGHYAQRPTPQAVWEPGHWVRQANGWLWVDGSWRMAEK